MSSGKERIRWSNKQNAWRRTIKHPHHLRRNSYLFLMTCRLCEAHDWRGAGTKVCRKCSSERSQTIAAIRSPAHAAVASTIKAGLLPALNPPPCDRNGQLIPIFCPDCGDPAEVYDHRDYQKPLDVVAVCFRCNVRRGPAIDIAHLVTRRFKRTTSI